MPTSSSHRRPAEGAADLIRLTEEFAVEMALTAQPKQAKAAAAIARRFVWQAKPDARGRIVTAAAVRRYLAGLAAAGRCRKTIWNHRSALSTWCEFLADQGAIDANPVPAVRVAGPERQPPRYLTPAEIRRVLAVARREGILAEVGLALATGLRLGELIRLEWRDVELDARTLLVRKSKSGRFRAVPLNAFAVQLLADQREATGDLRHVFPARRTWRGGWRYVDRRRAANWWKRAFRPIQAEVAKFTETAGTGRAWHLLRHTFASNLAQGGVSLYQIAEWLGHSSVEMAKRYAHLRGGYSAEIERALPDACREADQGSSDL